MNNENEILYKIMRELDGLQKREVLDITQRIELLLNVIESPINFKNLKHSIFAEFTKNDTSKAPYLLKYKGRLYKRIDYSDSMHLFKRVNGFLNFIMPKKTLYFKKTLNAEKLIKLNKKNVLEAFINTSYESSIVQFLQINKVTTVDSKSKRYRILLLEDKKM